MNRIKRPWVIVLKDAEVLKLLFSKEPSLKSETFTYKGKVLCGHIFDSDEDVISKIELFMYDHRQMGIDLFKKIRDSYVKCKLRNLQLIKRMEWLDERKKTTL